MNNEKELLQVLNRKISKLRGSRLALTQNMQFYREKVLLFKEIADLELEVKRLRESGF